MKLQTPDLRDTRARTELTEIFASCNGFFSRIPATYSRHPRFSLSPFPEKIGSNRLCCTLCRNSVFSRGLFCVRSKSHSLRILFCKIYTQRLRPYVHAFCDILNLLDVDIHFYIFYTYIFSLLRVSCDVS